MNYDFTLIDSNETQSPSLNLLLWFFFFLKLSSNKLRKISSSKNPKTLRKKNLLVHDPSTPYLFYGLPGLRRGAQWACWRQSSCWWRRPRWLVLVESWSLVGTASARTCHHNFFQEPCNHCRSFWRRVRKKSEWEKGSSERKSLRHSESLSEKMVIWVRKGWEKGERKSLRIKEWEKGDLSEKRVRERVCELKSEK